MFLRKIGKFLRGKATPFQIISATLLGALLGSLPGFGQGPLLLALLLFLLIILNANLFLAGLTLILVKLIYLILLPVYFHVGVFLLEGPLNGFTAFFVNAPVTAWFGFEYYVVLPSLITGAVLGIVLGVALSRALRNFRHKMATLESSSEKYQQYTSKFWVRALAWIFAGGIKGKKSWEELEGKRMGLPVRPVGVIFVVALLILCFIGLQLLDRTIVTSYVRDSLEQVNGATVDIDAVDIQAGENRVVVTGLAMANPEALGTNRFAAAEIEANISGMNLLAKKLVIDSLRLIQPEVGTERKVPGRRTMPPPEPEEEPEEGEDLTIEDYVARAEVWRERLALVKRLYDRVAPHLKKDKEEKVEGEPSWREKLAQRAEESGYASVTSESVIRKSPRLLIRSLEADNIEVGGNDDLFALSGSNLSTQPMLVAERGSLRVVRSDGKLEVGLKLPSTDTPALSSLNVAYRDLSVSELEEMAGKDLPMEGGSLDISGDGIIDSGILELPLQVTLKDTTLNAFGSSLPLDSLPLTVQVYGPLDAPKLSIPRDAIEQAVKEGGKQKLKNVIEEKAGDKLKGLFGG